MRTTFDNYITPLLNILQITAFIFFSVNNLTQQSKFTFLYPFIISIPFLLLYLNFIVNFCVLSRAAPKINHNLLLGFFCICEFILGIIYTIVYNSKIKTTFVIIIQNIKNGQNYKCKRVKLILYLVAYFFANIAWMLFYQKYLVFIADMHIFFLIHFAVQRNFLFLILQIIVLKEIKNEFSVINQKLFEANNLKYNKVLCKYFQNKGVLNMIRIADEHRHLTEVAQKFCNQISFRVLLQILFFYMMLALDLNPAVKFIFKFNKENIFYREQFWNFFFAILWSFVFLMSILVICYFWNSVKVEVCVFTIINRNVFFF